jgi:DNA-binding response OmpR family regulator
MDDKRTATVLLVEDNQDFANLVDLFLRRSEDAVFRVVWKPNGQSALQELETTDEYDIILMDHFLPGQNGVEITHILRDKGFTIPVVFLTVNKDFDLAVEVMKLGVEDYIVKEEISTPVFPKTILSVLERRALREELTNLEITQKRLEVIQEVVVQISGEIRTPLDGMKENIESLLSCHTADALNSYLLIIRDNLTRIERKLARLRELKTDRTVPYIRDIRMLDLSDEEQHP